MTSYDKATLGAQAAELGFIRDTLEKVLRLAEVLGFIDTDPLPSSSLALKGGTAINQPLAWPTMVTGRSTPSSRSACSASNDLC
jgi:hypothetical protein